MSCEILSIDKDNIDRVAIILNSVLQVSYPNQFYKQINSGKYRGHLAKIKDKFVGCIVWEINADGVLQVLTLGNQKF